MDEGSIRLATCSDCAISYTLHIQLGVGREQFPNTCLHTKAEILLS